MSNVVQWWKLFVPITNGWLAVSEALTLPQARAALRSHQLSCKEMQPCNVAALLVDENGCLLPEGDFANPPRRNPAEMY